MRFTITPLGSKGGRTVDDVVGQIVRYLDPPSNQPAPPAQRPPRTDGVTGYYADESTEPGRWLGLGARQMGLAGEVASGDFASVLAGRDPHTGARLITAQGSAGRRPTLARGNATRRDANGSPLYDLRDAASALKLELPETRRLVAAGEALAAQEEPSADAAPFGGSYLVPVTDREGRHWIAEAELARFEAARAAGPDPGALAAGGTADDLLGITEAAAMAGLSAQYLRQLCRNYHRNREQIEHARQTGKAYRRPFIAAERGGRGEWLLRRGDLAAFLRNRRVPAIRVGFDLTLTTEKSLGVLALLGDDATRAAVLDAIQAGNDLGLAHLERCAAKARVRGEPVDSRGWTVASFRHLTSRALDPFPHHHNVVANTVVDRDGVRRALDARWLYRHAGEASALATAEMRHRLSVALGVRWRRGRKGTWEIDGIPDEVLREFSRRSHEVDDAVAELEALIGRTATIGELRGLVTRTRPAKRRAEVAELSADWSSRARSHGFGPADLAACTGQALHAQRVDEKEVFARLASDDGLCAQRSIFTRSDVIAALVAMDAPGSGGQAQPLPVSAAELELLTDAFLASDHVVELQPDPGRSIASLGDTTLFTTTAMLAVQSRILDADRSGSSVGAAVVAPGVIRDVLGRLGPVSDEQGELVRSFCTSGRRVQCAVGRAGSGKTTAMRAAAAVWTEAGYRVLGAAVKGEAARLLGQEAEIPSETLAWYLAHTDPARSPLDGRTVLIVDEASTVSDRDLDQLLWLVGQTGAAVRLIGDPAQHGAVGAGGMFAVLCAEAGSDTPELRTSHRVANPADREAAEALRDGRIVDALAALEAAGHLHVAGDEIELYVDLLERWWQSRQAGTEHPMVDRRNHTRWQLNRLAHRLLQVTGEVGSEEILATGDRRFSVGERVVARRGDRSLHPPNRPADYVRNGATGTVISLVPDENHTRDVIRVAFGGIGEVDLPRSFFDERQRRGGRRDVGLDHAYAVTSYAVQGATFAESTSRIDEKASRSETYVDITRGRAANHLYLTRAADPLDGERLPRAPAPPIDATVTARLSASGPERAAIDVDPEATTRSGSTKAPESPRRPRRRR